MAVGGRGLQCPRSIMKGNKRKELTVDKIEIMIKKNDIICGQKKDKNKNKNGIKQRK